MPTVARTRAIAASPAAVWSLVADPHNLPRWFPETDRVEDVRGESAVRRGRFTQVMTTRKGRTVRADYRCTAATAGQRLVWEQQLEGTPFAGFLRSAEVEVRIDGRGAPGESTVTVTARRRLRGLSRLGSVLMRRATGRTLETALDGIERALVPGARSR